MGNRRWSCQQNPHFTSAFRLGIILVFCLIGAWPSSPAIGAVAKSPSVRSKGASEARSDRIDYPYAKLGKTVFGAFSIDSWDAVWDLARAPELSNRLLKSLRDEILPPLVKKAGDSATLGTTRPMGRPCRKGGVGRVAEGTYRGGPLVQRGRVSEGHSGDYPADGTVG